MRVNKDFKKRYKNFRKNIKIQNINLKAKIKNPEKRFTKPGSCGKMNKLPYPRTVETPTSACG